MTGLKKKKIVNKVVFKTVFPGHVHHKTSCHRNRDVQWSG